MVNTSRRTISILTVVIIIRNSTKFMEMPFLIPRYFFQKELSKVRVQENLQRENRKL